MVRYNPVFGIGRGNFLRYTNRLIAHNSAIEIMGETGFPGLFLWLGIIYMGFKNLSAAYRETEDAVLRSYVIALGLSVAGYLMSSMFVTLEYETFYLLLAFMAAVGHTLSAPPKFTRSDLWKIGAIMAVFFVGVKSLVMLYV
jgi:O-antigen ligase